MQVEMKKISMHNVGVVSPADKAPGVLCSTCGDFVLESEYSDHLLENHVALVECLICGQQLDLEDYEEHVSEVHIDQTEVLRCTGCHKCFKEEKEYLDHTGHCAHFLCDVCGLFVSAADYDKHITSCAERSGDIHSSSTDTSSTNCEKWRYLCEIFHICDCCSLLFTTKSNLVEHIAKEHEDRIWYTCGSCRTCFRTREEYHEHLMKEHSLDVPGESNVTTVPVEECKLLKSVHEDQTSHTGVLEMVGGDTSERIYVEVKVCDEGETDNANVYTQEGQEDSVTIECADESGGSITLKDLNTDHLPSTSNVAVDVRSSFKPAYTSLRKHYDKEQRGNGMIDSRKGEIEDHIGLCDLDIIAGKGTTGGSIYKDKKTMDNSEGKDKNSVGKCEIASSTILSCVTPMVMKTGTAKPSITDVTQGSVMTPGAVSTVGTGKTPGTVMPLGKAKTPGTVMPLGEGKTPGTVMPLGKVKTPGTVMPLGEAKTPGTVMPLGEGKTPGTVMPLGEGKTPGTSKTSISGLTQHLIKTPGAVSTLVSGKTSCAVEVTGRDAVKVPGTVQTPGTVTASDTVLTPGYVLTPSTGEATGTVMTPDAVSVAGSVITPRTSVSESDTDSETDISGVRLADDANERKQTERTGVNGLCRERTVMRLLWDRGNQTDNGVFSGSSHVEVATWKRLKKENVSLEDKGSSAIDLEIGRTNIAINYLFEQLECAAWKLDKLISFRKILMDRKQESQLRWIVPSEGRRVFSCILCGRIFLFREELIDHLKNHPSFTCDCQVVFLNKEAYDTHFQKYHMKLSPNAFPKKMKVLKQQLWEVQSTLNESMLVDGYSSIMLLQVSQPSSSGSTVAVKLTPVMSFLCVCGEAFRDKSMYHDHLNEVMTSGKDQAKHGYSKPWTGQGDTLSQGDMDEGDDPSGDTDHGTDDPEKTGHLSDHHLVRHEVDDEIHELKKDQTSEVCKTDLGVKEVSKKNSQMWYGCNVCPMAFGSRSIFLAHNSKHDSVTAKPAVSWTWEWKCSACSIQFSEKEGLHNHFSRGRCKLPDSKLISDLRWEDLQPKLETEVPEELTMKKDSEWYHCTLCPRAFATFPLFCKHKLRDHSVSHDFSFRACRPRNEEQCTSYHCLPPKLSRKKGRPRQMRDSCEKKEKDISIEKKKRSRNIPVTRPYSLRIRRQQTDSSDWEFGLVVNPDNIQERCVTIPDSCLKSMREHSASESIAVDTTSGQYLEHSMQVSLEEGSSPNSNTFRREAVRKSPVDCSDVEMSIKSEPTDSQTLAETVPVTTDGTVFSSADEVLIKTEPLGSVTLAETTKDKSDCEVDSSVPVYENTVVKYEDTKRTETSNAEENGCADTENEVILQDKTNGGSSEDVSQGTGFVGCDATEWTMMAPIIVVKKEIKDMSPDAEASGTATPEMGSSTENRFQYLSGKPPVIGGHAKKDKRPVDDMDRFIKRKKHVPKASTAKESNGSHVKINSKSYFESEMDTEVKSEVSETPPSQNPETSDVSGSLKITVKSEPLSESGNVTEALNLETEARTSDREDDLKTQVKSEAFSYSEDTLSEILPFEEVSKDSVDPTDKNVDGENVENGKLVIDEGITVKEEPMSDDEDSIPEKALTNMVYIHEPSEKIFADSEEKSDTVQMNSNSMWKCGICSESFGAMQLLVKHIRTHSTAKKDYKCSECDETFPTLKDAARHKEVHGSKQYVCPICKKVFYRSWHLKDHVDTHKSTPLTDGNVCQVCGSEFQEFSSLRKHMHCHYKDKARGMPGLEDDSANKLSLIPSMGKFPCDQCDKVFNSKNRRAVHIRYVHKGEVGNQCELCQKSFYSPSELQRHLRTHTGEKPFGCGVCGKSFALATTLKDHMMTHTGERPFKCPVCGKCYSSSSILGRHKITHVGARRFKCTVCSKDFSYANSLNIHMRTHTNERPYTCDICKKTFTMSCHFKVHMRIHTGEKPYKCKYCDVKFSNYGSHYRHVRGHSEWKEDNTSDKDMLPEDMELNEVTFVDSREADDIEGKILPYMLSSTLSSEFLLRHVVKDKSLSPKGGPGKNLSKGMVESCGGEGNNDRKVSGLEEHELEESRSENALHSDKNKTVLNTKQTVGQSQDLLESKTVGVTKENGSPMTTHSETASSKDTRNLKVVTVKLPSSHNQSGSVNVVQPVLTSPTKPMNKIVPVAVISLPKPLMIPSYTLPQGGATPEFPSTGSKKTISVESKQHSLSQKTSAATIVTASTSASYTSASHTSASYTSEAASKVSEAFTVKEIVKLLSQGYSKTDAQTKVPVEEDTVSVSRKNTILQRMLKDSIKQDVVVTGCSANASESVKEKLKRSLIRSRDAGTSESRKRRCQESDK